MWIAVAASGRVRTLPRPLWCTPTPVSLQCEPCAPSWTLACSLAQGHSWKAGRRSYELSTALGYSQVHTHYQYYTVGCYTVGYYTVGYYTVGYYTVGNRSYSRHHVTDHVRTCAIYMQNATSDRQTDRQTDRQACRQRHVAPHSHLLGTGNASILRHITVEGGQHFLSQCTFLQQARGEGEGHKQLPLLSTEEEYGDGTHRTVKCGVWSAADDVCMQVMYQ